jgi:hypothetical protein
MVYGVDSQLLKRLLAHIPGRDIVGPLVLIAEKCQTLSPKSSSGTTPTSLPYWMASNHPPGAG